MKILHKYLARELLVSLFFSVIVFTFVLTAGRVLPEFLRLLAQRVPPLLLLKHFSLVIPYLLTFSLPISMLTATILVFGKLSADSEINAIRASGVSLLNLISPAIVISICLVCVSLFINCYLAPLCKYASKTALLELGLRDPTTMIEVGEVTRVFPGYVLYVEKKASNTLFHVNVYVLDENGRPTQNLRANYAVVSVDQKKLILTLYDVRSEIRDPEDPTNLGKLHPGIQAKEYPLSVDIGKMLDQVRKQRDYTDMTFFDLLGAIYDLRNKGVAPGPLWFEAHKRIAGSFACFAFLLIAIPLGIKTHRRETSVGVLISLGLVLIYYVCLVLAQNFKNQPQFYPELILWTPNIAFEVLGLVLLWRTSRV